MTLKTRLTRLEEHEAEAFVRQLRPLTNDALDARLAVFSETPIPRHLYEPIKGEYLRRLRLMTAAEMEAWEVAHFTPEERARNDARFAAAMQADGWVLYAGEWRPADAR